MLAGKVDTPILLLKPQTKSVTNFTPAPTIAQLVIEPPLNNLKFCVVTAQ